LKICIISTSALPAPTIGYGGLENIAYDSAAELAKMENDVTLITTDQSSQLGMHQAVDEGGAQKGSLNVISAGPTAWDALGERNMYLRYRQWLEQEFGQGQGVIIDHTWFGWVYFSLTGFHMENPIVEIAPHPEMKIMHVIHGVTGWRRGSEYVPPRTQFPRILGVSRGHAQYLSNCFKIPVRHVHNGIHLPDKPLAPLKGDYLLSLNRISAEKGIHNAIDVALATGNKIKLVGDDTHVADPRYVWETMNRCEESGGRASYIGPVSNEDKWEYIRGCKALIACPDMVSYVESFYLAAIEGFAMGKPILAFPNGGLNDTVKNGVNGFLCENAETMKEVLLRERLEDMNPDAIRAEAEKYTVETMARGYLDLCKGVFINDAGYMW
jgi:glycosyltransferase involved in cell wall biosynthesis